MCLNVATPPLQHPLNSWEWRHRNRCPWRCRGTNANWKRKQLRGKSTPYNFVHLVNLTTHSAWCMYFNRENISHSLSVFLCITRVSASRYTKFIFKLCVSNWLLGVRRCSKISKVWSSVRQRARCSLLQWELLGSLLWSASLPDGCGFAAAPPPAPASPPAAPAPATKSSLLASPHCWQSCTLSSDATCHLINMIVTIAIDNDLKLRGEGLSLSSLRGCSPEGNVDEVGWEGAVPRLGCC